MRKVLSIINSMLPEYGEVCMYYFQVPRISEPETGVAYRSLRLIKIRNILRRVALCFSTLSTYLQEHLSETYTRRIT